MIIHYTPQAQRDLRLLQWYILTKLQNKNASSRIPQMILKNCAKLKKNPYLGFALAEKIDLPTEYRCLVCEAWLVFYKVEGQCISVERIIDGRTDYINVILNH